MSRTAQAKPVRTASGKPRAAAPSAPSTLHDDAVAHELRDDPALAAEYVKAAIAEGDEPKVLLIALRQLAKAHGIAKVAERAQIERESLYRALSDRGNPRFSTIVAVLGALGLVLTVQPASTATHRRVRVTRVGTKTSARQANRPRPSRAA
jgi:probable addiction module antidote protein